MVCLLLADIIYQIYHWSPTNISTKIQPPKAKTWKHYLFWQLPQVLFFIWSRKESGRKRIKLDQWPGRLALAHLSGHRPPYQPRHWSRGDTLRSNPRRGFGVGSSNGPKRIMKWIGALVCRVQMTRHGQPPTQPSLGSHLECPRTSPLSSPSLSFSHGPAATPPTHTGTGGLASPPPSAPLASLH